MGEAQRDFIALTHSVRPQRWLPASDRAEPEPVIELGPASLDGDEEAEVVDMTGRIVHEAVAFLERFGDERDLALLEVTDPAVDELGAARRGAVREVAGFDEGGF